MADHQREIWGVAYPIALDERRDGCAITGTDAKGRRIHYDDLLSEGDTLGQVPPNVQDNVFPPYATVVHRDGGLWVDLDESKEER